MAKKKFTELPQADTITGAEVLAMVQDGDSVQGDIDLIKAYFDTLYAPVAQYAKFSDTKSANTESGGITSGAYVTRTINTTDNNAITSASLGSNQITLPAGTYECDIILYGYYCDRHKSRLRNITDGTNLLIGTSAFSGTATAAAPTITAIRGRFTLASSKAIEVQHRVQTTNATNAGGPAANLGESEVYLVAEFWKVA